MHIAAANPVAVDRDGVPEEVLNREKDIYVQQALESGKPENIVEKIVSGKMEKFLAEICLLEQKYVKDPDISIQDLLTDCMGKTGENVSINRFSCFQVGVE